VRVRAGDARDDDEVAVRPAVRARLALPLEANLRAILHPRLDLDRVVPQPALTAGAVALRARPLDHGAVAAAARAGLREREQALALGLDPPAVALRADDRRRARLSAGAAAVGARDRQLDRDLHLVAAERVPERQ